MSERDEYRQLLERARRLARLPIDIEKARDALAAVRGQLARADERARKNRRRKLLVVMSGSLAAAIATIIALILVSGGLPKKVDAAEELQNAANATQDYRGWVHITPIDGGGLLSGLTLHLESIHVNTADRSHGIVLSALGMRTMVFASAAKHEMQMYTSMSGTIVVSTIKVDRDDDATRQSAEFPLKLADLLKQIKSRQAAPNVIESVDQGLQKFDLTLTDDAKKTPDQYPEMPNGKLTLWVDPQTRLIRRMTSQIDGQPVVLQYTYGVPEIHDIYDLGVPKTAEIVDSRQTPEKRPPVFELPPVAQLVKDDTIDLKALEARLKKRSESDWGDSGDYVMIFTKENKNLSGANHRQGYLSILGQQGEMSVSSSYMLVPEMALFGGPGFPKGWPTPRLADVVSMLKSVKPQGFVVYDGKNTWQSEGAGGWVGTINDKTGKVEMTPATRPSRPLQMKSGTYLWPSTEGTFPGMGTTKVEVLRDPAHPGLIVLHLHQTIPNRKDKAAPDFQTDRMDWLDPAHDDLSVETVTREDWLGEMLATPQHTVVLDFGRIGNGQWYPSHWQFRFVRPATTQPDENDSYEEYWQQILKDEKLGPEWYGNPNLRFGGTSVHFLTTRPAPAQ